MCLGNLEGPKLKTMEEKQAENVILEISPLQLTSSLHIMIDHQLLRRPCQVYTPNKEQQLTEIYALLIVKSMCAKQQAALNNQHVHTVLVCQIKTLANYNFLLFY